MDNSRNYRIDVLKGIAIIAVVFYHLNWNDGILGGGGLTSGYLGVDIFLVVSGYFMMKSIIRAMRENRFSYWKYLKGRIARLWPMILITAAIALGVGAFTMLPDDFENLSQSVIASNVFANNVLSYITTGNYWDVANVFKPLMHTWYVGVLLQAYVALPLIYFGIFKITKGNINAVKICVIFITLISLIGYAIPIASAAEKFYLLPFRAFEITVGNLIAFAPRKRNITRYTQYVVEIICFPVILFLLCMNIPFPSAAVKLLIVVCATVALIVVFENTEEKSNKFIKIFSYIGRASFSIYLCHQVIVAYMYYAVTDRKNLQVFLIFVLVVTGVSITCYLGLEKPLEAILKRNTWYVLVPSMIACLITSLASGWIYLHAGVIRDVPELGVETTNVHRGMHAEYCDIPYSWNKDFESTDKVKVVVIGDSFGRDWANILNESSIADKIEISYIYPSSNSVYNEYSKRLLEADVVFRTFSKSTVDVEESLPDIVSDNKMYIVGYKNFGSSNGIIYSHRGSADYYEQAIRLPDDVLENNQVLKEQYGDHYIDMIEPVQNDDGSVRVFTDDNYFISQDCRHLTKYGAQYYGRIMDLSWIVELKNMS